MQQKLINFSQKNVLKLLRTQQRSKEFKKLYIISFLGNVNIYKK
jgi:hypothetical protein